MGFFRVAAICIVAVAVLTILIICLKSGRFFKSFMVNLTLGITILILLNLLNPFTNFKIPVNEYTLPICAFGGIPGVVLILILPFIV